jgi:rhodanese-related sulfurtransferase
MAVLTLLILYLAWKYSARRRVLREVRMARISPDELHQLMVSGSAPVIIDARSRSELAVTPFVIEGAYLMTAEEIDEQRIATFRGREVVVYCSCPNEITSARLALKLQRLGVQRVRPLAGGIDAWRARNLPSTARQELLVGAVAR